MPSQSELDQAQVVAYEQRYREAVQPRVGEDVQAVGAFQRTGRYMLTVPLIGQLGAALYAVYGRLRERGADALPMHFLLAVTPRKVHAFKYRPSVRGKLKVGREVAVWERAEMVVAATADGAISSAVTFHVGGTGEPRRIACSTGKLSTNPWSERVLELLGGDEGARASATAGGVRAAGSS